MSNQAHRISRPATRAFLILLLGSLTVSAHAQSLTPPSGGMPKEDAAGKARPVPTPSSPKAKIAASSGKIAVNEAVSNEVMQRTLEGLLNRYPGVRKLDITVDNGFVTLDGQVDNDGTHNDITNFVRRVEGVRLVLNLMKTDDEVMSATELARRQISSIAMFFARNWSLMLLSLSIVLVSLLLARLFWRYSESLLSPFVGNTLLRSVLGSLLGAAIVVAGTLGALNILDLTQAVLSILGLAGVAGLAIGFAFKDIAENFIASVLLGVRRPFRVGDSVQVAGRSGVVQSLNTRATVLVTPEGKHVRIPNSVIYKEILVNESASARTRSNFDVLIPYEASTSDAVAAMTEALRGQDGILPDPAPRVLVNGLEISGVRLQATYWTPTQGVDGDQLVSDARLKVKAALQQRGILMTTPMVGPWQVHPGQATPPAPDGKPHPGVTSPETIHANIRRDAEAAANTGPVADGRTCAISPGLLERESRVDDEGANLLKGRQTETNGRSK